MLNFKDLCYKMKNEIQNETNEDDISIPKALSTFSPERISTNLITFTEKANGIISERPRVPNKHHIFLTPTSLINEQEQNNSL